MEQVDKFEESHNTCDRGRAIMEQQQFGPPKGVDPNKLPHLSIVICGHVDSGIPPLPHLSVLTIWMSDSMVLRPAGKSTVTGRLLYELGMFSAHDLDKLRAEVSFAPAFPPSAFRSRSGTRSEHSQ